MKLERLAALVESVSGIVFSAGQLVHLHELMSRRAGQLGMTDLAAYVLALERGRLEEEWRVLLPAITVKESYLFRIPEQFHALAERLLSDLVAARRGGELRIWSAGCANGEEPATLAVVLAEAGLPAPSWSILGTDVDERALQQAASGLFSQRAVSQVPVELLRRYFAPHAGGWMLDDELLRRITFTRVNLVREPLPPLGGPFDLVFLRNVLIYFRPESQRRVVESVTDTLAEHGYLFLGHSESLWQLSARLGPVDLGGCFAYRRQALAAAATAKASATSGDAAPPRRLVPAATRTHSHPHPRAVSAGGGGARREAPPAMGEPVAPPLAEAVVALAGNRLQEARQLATRRVAAEPADAAAHAVLGLVADLAGDGDAALAAYRAALFLRPRLYLVRFQLAERLRRAGWHERARAEYLGVLATLAEGGEELAELEPLRHLLPSRGTGIAGHCRAALKKL